MYGTVSPPDHVIRSGGKRHYHAQMKDTFHKPILKPVRLIIDFKINAKFLSTKIWCVRTYDISINSHKIMWQKNEERKLYFEKEFVFSVLSRKKKIR